MSHLRSVSPPRSSNAACGFPALRSPIGFIAGIRRLVTCASTMLPSVLASRHSLLGTFPVSFSGLQATPIHRPSPSSTSTPEVRVLSSAGVTRHQRSYDPVRLPPAPSPCGDVEAATLAPNGHPPITRSTFPTCRAHYPDGPERVHLSVASQLHSGLPRFSGGSASITSLSSPAQASHALRPVGLLSRPRRPLSRGFSPAGYPSKPLVSYQVLPTTSWVDPSSTGEPRLWGALRIAG